MEREIPEDDSFHETREVGTAVHEANELNLKGTPVAPGYLTENNIVITQEMLNRGKIYVDLVRNLPGERYIEQRIDCARIHPECFGTPDAVIYNQEFNHLIVVDYKDGFIDVDVEKNLQLITYATGWIELLSNGGTNALENTMTVELIIVQPRAGGIKQWSTTAVALRPFINKLSHACNEALSDNPKASAGPHCKYCKARAVCSSLGNTSQNFVAVAESTPVQPNIAQELAFLEYAESVISARKMAIHALAMQNPPEGWTVGIGRGRKAWTADNAMVENMGALYGVDLMKAPLPVTPLQAITAGMPKDIIDGMSNMLPGKPKLEKINMNALKDAFGGK